MPSKLKSGIIIVVNASLSSVSKGMLISLLNHQIDSFSGVLFYILERSPRRFLFPESWFWPPDTIIDSALADDYILSYFIFH